MLVCSVQRTREIITAWSKTSMFFLEACIMRSESGSIFCSQTCFLLVTVEFEHCLPELSNLVMMKVHPLNVICFIFFFNLQHS